MDRTLDGTLFLVMKESFDAVKWCADYWQERYTAKSEELNYWKEKALFYETLIKGDAI